MCSNQEYNPDLNVGASTISAMKNLSILLRSSRIVRCIASALALLLMCGGLAAPPANFVLEDVITGLDQPMAVRFFSANRILVLQKKGLVKIVDLSTSPAQSAIY